MMILKILRRHPFPVVAHFERVLAVSFAFPVEAVRPLVPAGLEIDAYEGLGFVTVALVWTRRLRPAGFPAFLGQDFFLAGYRIFTRLRDESGRRLRGLKILRSETNRQRMVWLGNAMTGYRYQHVRVSADEANGNLRIKTTGPHERVSLDLTVGPSGENVPLPESSPFPDGATARRFAGPMPFTFSDEGDGNFVVVEGSRQNWTPRPLAVQSWKVALFDDAPLAGVPPRLANAFCVENIDYRWKRGRLVKPDIAP